MVRANFDARIFGGDPDFLFFVSLVVIPLLQSHFCGIFYFSLRYPFVHSLLLVFFSFLAVTFPPFTYSDGASRFPLISEANAWVDDVYYTPLPIVTIKRFFGEGSLLFCMIRTRKLILLPLLKK